MKSIYEFQIRLGHDYFKTIKFIHVATSSFNSIKKSIRFVGVYIMEIYTPVNISLRCVTFDQMKKTKSKSKTKFENNWLFKSLESLEKDYWGEIPKDEGRLVTTCHTLRKKQLKEFDTEDLRIMIGQNIGLKYLIPLALETLQMDILAEGDLYDGDLLKMVLTSNQDYWKTETENWTKMRKLFRNRIAEIEKDAAEYDTGRKILKVFKEFEKIN